MTKYHGTVTQYYRSHDVTEDVSTQAQHCASHNSIDSREQGLETSVQLQHFILCLSVKHLGKSSHLLSVII